MCLFTAFLFFSIKASAQKNVEAKGVMIVRLSVPGYDAANLKVPISKSDRNRYRVRGGWGCGECNANQPSEVSYSVDAVKLSKNQIIFNFKSFVTGIDDEKKHTLQRIFIIHQNRKIFIKLKYGIKITAYYKSKNGKAR